MATETVNIVVDKSWSLLANAAGVVAIDVLSGRALVSSGDTVPADGSSAGSDDPSYRFTTTTEKVWARAAGDGYATLAVTRVVDAANVAAVVLPAATISANAFSSDVVAGTELATINANLAGASVERISPADGRVVLSADRTKLIRGLSTVTGEAIEITIYTTHPKAAASPRATKLTLTVNVPALTISGVPTAATDGQEYVWRPVISGGLGRRTVRPSGRLADGWSVGSRSGEIRAPASRVVASAGAIDIGTLTVTDEAGQTATLNVGSLAVNGGGGGGAAKPDKIVANTRFIFNNNRIQVTSEFLQNYGNIVTLISPPWSGKGPQFCFAGFVGGNRAPGTGEIALGNDVNYETLFIEINDVKYPLKVGGSKPFVVPNGGHIWNDKDDTIVLPANTLYRVGWALNVPLNANIPQSTAPLLTLATMATTSGRGDVSSAGNTSRAAVMEANTAGGAPNPTTVMTGAPINILMEPIDATEKPKAKAVGVFGNSIAVGIADVYGPYGIQGTNGRGEMGAIGWVCRALNRPDNGRVAWFNYGISGSRCGDIAAGRFDMRRATLEAMGMPFTSMIAEMGTNTASNAANAAAAVADQDAMWAYLKAMAPGRKLIACTNPLQTLALDDATGTANTWGWTLNDDTKQRRGAAATNDAMNANARGAVAAGKADGLIDVTSVLESSAGSGKWKSPGDTCTADAVSSGKTISILSGVVPKPGEEWLAEPGTANTEIIIFETVTGSAYPYTATVKANIAKAHLAGWTLASRYVEDGLHLTTQGVLLPAPLVFAAKAML